MSIEGSKTPEAFSAFELAGWDENIAGYDQAFGPVASQTVAPMLDAAHLGPSASVLDVCCGQGVLAAGASARGARVVGVDFAPAAVALARTKVPGVEFRQGNAQDLAFPDATFDVVLCGYGLMHVPSPGGALAEMRRVLRPGGRIAVSVWDAAGVGFMLVYMAVRSRGNMDVPLPHGPDFFQFGTAEKMTAALTEIGFADAVARSVSQTWHIPDADAYVAAILGGAVRSRAVLRAQTQTARTSVRDFIADYIERFRDPAGGFAIPMPAIVGSGTR